MTSKELGEEIEVIVKDLCKFGGRQDKYALEVVDEIKKRLEILEFIKTHFEMSGFNELIPIYLDNDDDEKFNKLGGWLENE